MTVRQRACAMSVVALALVALMSASPAAAASRHGRSHGRSGTKLARTLARKMTHGSVKARERAMLTAMRDLHIGVVTKSGKALVVAPEIGGAQYFQLYAFELRGFAEQLRAGSIDPLGTMAARLGALAGGSLKVARKPVSAAAVRTLLVNTTRYAMKHSRDPSSRLALLVRALGRRHKGPRYDLAKAPRASKIALDPMQSSLVEMGLVLPILRGIRAKAPGRAHAQRTARASGIASGCKRLLDLEAAAKRRLAKALGSTRAGRWIESVASGYDGRAALKGGWAGAKLAIKHHLGKLAKGLVESGGLKKAFGYLTQGALVALPAAGALHDIMLAEDVRVATSGGFQQTHWSHGDAATGKPMTFVVAVRMSADLGKGLINCGALAGFKIPPKGPMAGVPVSWHDQSPIPFGPLVQRLTGSVDDLLTPKLGTTNCGTLPCTTTTGANGVTQLVFTPKTEPIPGAGAFHEKHGHIYPLVLYQSAEGGSPLIGKIAQYLFPKGVENIHWKAPSWQVSYHDVPNLDLYVKATVTPRYLHPPVDSTTPISCGQAITSITNTGAVTAEGSVPLTLTTPGATDADELTWEPAGPLPLSYSDKSLDSTTNLSPPVGDCPFPLPTKDDDFILNTEDGTMAVDKLEWSKSAVRAGTAGISAELEMTKAPAETYYDTSTPADQQNGPQNGWADAVNQLIGLGTDWDENEYDVTGNHYWITGWQRSATPGVYATWDFNSSGIVDNQTSMPIVDVAIHMELRPVAAG